MEIVDEKRLLPEHDDAVSLSAYGVECDSQDAHQNEDLLDRRHGTALHDIAPDQQQQEELKVDHRDLLRKRARQQKVLHFRQIHATGKRKRGIVDGDDIEDLADKLSASNNNKPNKRIRR
jgi:hypothetical protein